MNRTHPNRPFRLSRAIRSRRAASATDLGQAGLVLVVAFCVLASLVGAVIVQTVITSNPLFQTKAVEIYAHRAMEAGQNAFLTAVNANPSLAQCSSNTNSAGTCSGIDYGQWNLVNNSNASGSDAQYYAFGNPQPTFDSTTHALTTLSVQVVGAAYDPSATNNYLIDEETMTVTPSNGFLTNVWWSNYESYNSNGDYSTCNYNWKLNYDINGSNASCGGGNNNGSPVYFGPNDYLFGPVYTNDSVFVSPSPDFGTTANPSTVTTADPHCLFVDNSTNRGMNGNYSNCAAATSDVGALDSANSSYGHSVEQPPANDTQLATIAGQNGCLYSGPTQITLSTDANGNGQMTVVSPDTSEGTQTVQGTSYPWDTNNIITNVNNCPANGTAPLPSNGVVFVQNATNSQTQAWANPFDDPTYNSATNVTSNPASPQVNKSVTLTATVTSGSSSLTSGATVAFKQTTKTGSQTTSNTISSCSAQSLTTVTPATNPPTATATCTFTEASNGTGAFTAVYSGGNNTTSSQGNLGQNNTFSSSVSYGPDAQVTAGGCSNCYYGQTSTPDAEGDAFVNGSLSGQLTIGTANNVIIDGNITYADCNWTTGQSGLSVASKGLCPYNSGGTNDVLGMIANNYVEVNRPLLSAGTLEPSCGANPAPTCDPSNGSSGITIDAAVLALTQSFVVNNYSVGSKEGPLIVYGSIQQYARGPVGTFSGTSLVSGYQKFYTWNPLLDFVSPPSYLTPSTPSWVLQGVANNAGNGAVDTCPPLDGPYGSGSSLTTYCSDSPGGLPNFPSVTAPSAPTNVTATPNNDGSVTVTWNASVSNGASAITGYSVVPNPGCTSCTVTNLSSTSATVSGLTRHNWYNFAVTATNAVGTSNPSVASNSVMAPDVPAAPTNVSATTNQNGSVTVSWTDPANNGSTISGYGIVPSPACGSCSYTNLSGSTLSSATVSGLTPGGTYSFTVTATNGVGTGSASTASNSVVAPNVPAAPTIGTAVSGNGSASVSWTAPTVTNGSTITGYVVTPYLNGTTAQSPQTFVSTATSQTVTGLTNGSAYTFKVAAINGVGTGAQSAASNSVTVATTPGAPTIGTATAGVGSATVTWTAPGSTGGQPITGYVVTPYIGSTAQAAQTFASTATTEVVSSLTAGSSYTFKVAAINSVGTGSLSSATSSVTIPTVPGTPTGVTGSTGTTTKTVNISWTAPSNGGSAITGYTVSAYTGTTLIGTATVTGVTNTNLAFSPALTSGTTYTFKVAATNAVGTGSQTSGTSIKAK